MQTHYLGTEEVRGYLRDFVARLKVLGESGPKVWVPIGTSGRELVKELIEVSKDLDGEFTPVPAEFDRQKSAVIFENDAAGQILGKNVLVIDSSVHSGYTMRAIVDKVCALGAVGICSYTLVMKRGASFIPSYWGVSIGDYDRAYFLLKSLPNNHFHDGGSAFGQVRERPAKITHPNRDPYFHLRKLSKSDLERPSILSGLSSLDRTTWADRYYDMLNHEGRITYLLEAGLAIHGYVTIDFRNGSILSIEAVAVDKALHGRGYGAALIRWAETLARQSQCRTITLWSIKDQMPTYKRLGYSIESEKRSIVLDGEEYAFMSKPVLYHL